MLTLNKFVDITFSNFEILRVNKIKMKKNKIEFNIRRVNIL